jgi:glycerol-1-phosphate dehydrogenase [NAD(P)+]
MKLLWQHKPAILHGAKVGAASVICAAYYDKLRQISRSEVIKQLDKARQPTREQYEREIAQAYPGIEDKVLAEQKPFMELSAQGYEELKQKIVDRWSDIQEIAAAVPSAQQMAAWLRQVGGETELEALGFTSAEIKEAVEYSHLLRNRFNVNKLWHLCGIEII